MNVELLFRRVLEALVNGGYQGLLLTAVVFAVLRLMRRSSAATRHNICLVTLLLVALLPAAHFARSTSMFTWIASSPIASDHFDGVMAATDPARENRSHGYWLSGGANGLEPNSKFQGISESNEQEGEHVASGFENEGRRIGAIQTDAAGESSKAATSIQSPEWALLEPGLPDSSDSRGSASALPQWNVVIPFSSRQCAMILGGIGAIGLIRFGALARQLWALRGLKRRSERASGELRERFDAVGKEMRVQRSVTLLVAQGEQRFSPCAVGFWRPAVILPEGMLGGGTENAEAILRHELAHIDRRDDWTTLFQQVTHALLFFHPAVWMLSRRLSVEREIACDDHVLAAQPNRRKYALLLTEFAGQAGANRFTAAPAAWGRKTQLKRRIDMILNKNRNSSPRSSRGSVGVMGATAALAAVLGIGFAPQIAVAQPAAEPASPDDEIASADVAPPSAGVAIAAPVPVSPYRARAAVTAAVPVMPGVPYVAAEPPAAPEPARTGSTPRKARARADGSVEERLDRLEKMIEELVAREKGGFEYGGYGRNSAFHDAWQGHDPKEFGRMQRELERASRDAERAAKEAMKGLQGAQKNWNFDGFHQSFQLGDFKNSKAQRKALEAQRKALEKQLEAIEQRLDALQDEEEADQEAEEDQIKEKIKDKQNKPLEKEKFDSETGDAPKR